MRQKTPAGNSNEWEVIIVGAGPAGCAAAMVLARSRRRVLVIDEGIPRNRKSEGIHNYLTRDGILPGDFARICRDELQQYATEVVKGRAVKAEITGDKKLMVTDADGRQYKTRKLLIATGVTDIIPDIPGMAELWGRGVYHCPYCDGWTLYTKTVGLYARRFNGYGMALALKHLAGKVILFTDTARYLKAAQRNHLITMDIDIVSTAVKELSCSEGKLTCVQLADGSSVACDYVFTHNGVRYNNDLVVQLGGQCNTKGAVLTNRQQECNVPGVYVAGDTAYDMQFVTVAAAEGVKAAVAIHNSLLKESNEMVAAELSTIKKAGLRTDQPL